MNITIGTIVKMMERRMEPTMMAKIPAKYEKQQQPWRQAVSPSFALPVDVASTYGTAPMKKEAMRITVR